MYTSDIFDTTKTRGKVMNFTPIAIKFIFDEAVKQKTKEFKDQGHLFSKCWESWFDEYKSIFTGIISQCFKSLHKIQSSTKALVKEYIKMIDLYDTNNRELIRLYHEYANVKTLFDTSIVMYRKESALK